MRLLIQRVKEARVEVNERVIGAIQQGLLIFLGIHHADTDKHLPWLVNKVAGLRCFSDDAGKMNLSLTEINGGALVVSQFTLYGNCQNGRRPDFLEAAPPAVAIPLYNSFITELKRIIPHVQTGEFAADMQVHLINDGPVTFLIER